MTLYPLSSNTDPFPQYLTQNEANQLYRPKTINLLDSEIPATIARDTEITSAVNSHLAVSNPHNITPNLIGASTTTHTHTMTQVSGTLPISQGGTERTTRQGAMNMLAGGVTNNRFLRGNGTNIVLSQVSLNTADVTGILPQANGGTGASVLWDFNPTDRAYTLQSGWTQYSATSWPFKIFENYIKFVKISGLLTRTNSTNNIICGVPRPQHNGAANANLMFLAMAFYNNKTNLLRVDIDNAGQLKIVNVVMGDAIPQNITWLQIDFTYVPI